MPAIKYTIWLCLALLAGYPGYARQKADTLRLYFELDKATVTAEAAQKLDTWLYNDKIAPGKSILIIGYTDYLGGDAYNERLSENRALAIQNYLTGMGIPPHSIKLRIGKGEIKRAVEKADGYPTDRRVDVVVADTIIQEAAPPTMAGKKAPASKPTPSSPSIPIVNIKPGGTIVLDKIYFYAGRHVVREESLAELDNLFNVLDTHPEIKIRIEGHVCCVKTADALDEDTFEMALSENRARYIYEYLVQKGIDKNRLSYIGFGRTKPVVAYERTEEDENKNRRVEIRVLKN